MFVAKKGWKYKEFKRRGRVSEFGRSVCCERHGRRAGRPTQHARARALPGPGKGRVRGLSLEGKFTILAAMSQSFSGLVEFAPSFEARPEISRVLFDFDGTLSLIREGWPVVMLGMFEEMLPARADDSPAAVRQMLTDDMMGLNGKQTIYQMMRFAERVQERGGVPQEPLWYKHEYLRRLGEKIEVRLSGLKDGSIPAEKYLLHGSIALLEDLQARGMTLILASGTDEQFVKAEAALLGVSKYFGERIYGAKDDYKSFSKKMVIERLLKENNIQGRELLAFGDGYVEIQNTKEAGGLAVGVASDEANNGGGAIDAWKRNRLMGVGADVLVPDYRDAGPLLRKIFGR
jgi:phosphoglycolate phosphatase-like HAD superfamily hydrolase